MATYVSGAGVATPAFALAPDAQCDPGVRCRARLAGHHQAADRQLQRRRLRLDGPEDCDALEFDDDIPQMVQAFDDRTIYHVDGYFDGAKIGPFRASRYLRTTPLGFRNGSVLGSVEEDDPALISAIGAFSERAMAALTDGPSMLHLELFVDRETGDCAFLEVGARVGGGEIPFVWRELHGWDLMEAGFRLALGLEPPAWPSSFTEVGGFILVPAPATRPCRVTEATSMLGRASRPVRRGGPPPRRHHPRGGRLLRARRRSFPLPGRVIGRGRAGDSNNSARLPRERRAPPSLKLILRLVAVSTACRGDNSRINFGRDIDGIP